MSRRLRRQVRAREPTLGTWVSLADPAVAEIGAYLGYDFALVDTEHTPLSLETVMAMARAVDAADGDTELLVRVPWNDPVRIKRVLDIGVAGVMVPMVETATEARTVVDATRYPPDGIRGIAAGRAARYGLDFEETVAEANEEVLTIVQIETERGLANAAAIADVDGIDALFVGPADLSAALGVFAEWEGDRLTEAIDRVLEVAHDVDKPVATLALRTAEIETRIEQGFDFLIAGIDATHLIEGGQRTIEAFETALGDADD